MISLDSEIVEKLNKAHIKKSEYINETLKEKLDKAKF